MIPRLIFLIVFFVTGFLGETVAQPAYSSANFHQSVNFKKSSDNYYYLNDAVVGYLNEFVSLNFTIEFWVKVLPNIKPGTRIFASNMMGMNFSSGTDINGNTRPGLWFDIWSYDNSGYPSPSTDGEFYHALAASIPNDGEWMHVAIVKNINQSGADPLYPLETRVFPGEMALYINGKLANVARAPLSMTTLSISNFIIGNLGGAGEYLKIDEFRFWGIPLVRSQIEANMNQEVNRNTGSLILYYDFSSLTSIATGFVNKSRGWGSPTSNESPGDFSLELYSPAGTEKPYVENDLVYTTRQPGNWNDPNTWSGSIVPQPGEMVTINNDITISTGVEIGGIVLNNGKLNVDGGNLTLLSSPLGGNPNSYIKTENGGTLSVNAIYKYGVQVPVGGESYNPLYVERDSYEKEKFTFSSSDNLSAVGIAASQPGVKNLWYITPQGGTTLVKPLSVKMYWSEEQEQNRFDIAQAQIGNLHNGSWTYLTVDSVISHPLTGMKGVAYKTTRFSPFIPINNSIQSLPATFGNIDAFLRNGHLVVNWQTLSETNNSHFNIQVSRDGQVFTTIKSLSSKATDGNSNVQLDYEYNAPLTTLAHLGIAAVVCLCCMGYSLRRLLWIPMLFIVLCTTFFVACSKKGADIDISENEKLFVRIMQVDKDGSSTYSNVVKVQVK